MDTWRHNDIIDAHAERPCPHNEVNCIRRYFDKHSNCKVAHGLVPDPFFIRSTLAIASANLTYTMNDVKVSKLNGNITEFTYDSITFTAVIPNVDKVEFTKTEVFSYIENGNVPYAVGPGVIKSTDTDVIRSFNKMVSNVPDGVKEAMVFQGPIFMLNFIQYTICDFGFKIIST
ncbi:uncharacterized protein LOC115446531 [Manduca sexta]|uniref:uncharacterized protein LOC115446531 n=1 Tax=Manduca sexta TaxID=7130 RepID=UPI0011822AC9|nr:uncharacterized protein LOC115446531 [Manduca sexta]